MSLMVIAMLQGSVKKAVNAAPDVHRATDCDRQVPDRPTLTMASGQSCPLRSKVIRGSRHSWGEL